MNDLIQLFGSLNDSVPSQSRQKPPSDTEDGLVLLSFLDSCRLSLSGISVTVSTPLSTAIRFSTGKIDMHLANASANNSTATLQRDTLTRFVYYYYLELSILIVLLQYTDFPIVY